MGYGFWEDFFTTLKYMLALCLGLGAIIAPIVLAVCFNLCWFLLWIVAIPFAVAVFENVR